MVREQQILVARRVSGDLRKHHDLLPSIVLLVEPTYRARFGCKRCISDLVSRIVSLRSLSHPVPLDNRGTPSYQRSSAEIRS